MDYVDYGKGTNSIFRQFGSGEGAIQTQPATEELRRDGADHAIPQLDMSGAVHTSENGWVAVGRRNSNVSIHGVMRWCLRPG